jgi:hypothetical protein
MPFTKDMASQGKEISQGFYVVLSIGEQERMDGPVYVLCKNNL